jgi:hypothetical protein
MKCRICQRELATPTDTGHVAERAPTPLPTCLGCWMFSVQLALFLARCAPERCIMGDWESNWLREILKDPLHFGYGYDT